MVTSASTDASYLPKEQRILSLSMALRRPTISPPTSTSEPASPSDSANSSSTPASSSRPRSRSNLDISPCT
jgi:hypothetical protein